MVDRMLKSNCMHQLVASLEERCSLLFCRLHLDATHTHQRVISCRSGGSTGQQGEPYTPMSVASLGMGWSGCGVEYHLVNRMEHETVSAASIVVEIGVGVKDSLANRMEP